MHLVFSVICWLYEFHSSALLWSLSEWEQWDSPRISWTAQTGWLVKRRRSSAEWFALDFEVVPFGRGRPRSDSWSAESPKWSNRVSLLKMLQLLFKCRTKWCFFSVFMDKLVGRKWPGSVWGGDWKWNAAAETVIVKPTVTLSSCENPHCLQVSLNWFEPPSSKAPLFTALPQQA